MAIESPRTGKREMHILFVGSSRHLVEGDQRSDFQQACREIGEACAKQKVTIIVGSDKPNTADRYIVEGAAQTDPKLLNGNLPIIWVIRPDYGTTPFNEKEFAGKIAVQYRRFQGAWKSGRVPQIVVADAIVLIGGDEGTRISGHVALALNKPVLTVPFFKGAGQEMWAVFEPFYRSLGDANEINALKETWKNGNAAIVITGVKQLVKRRVFDPRPRMPMGIFLTMLLTCLTVWTYLFAQTPIRGFSPIYSYFVMLAVAGILGTILRTSLRLIRDDTATFSWNQLLLELAAGLLLGFALALLYLVGSITVSGKVELLTDDPGGSGFQRVAVVMTLLGLGGGLALEQASDRVSRWFDDQFHSGPPAK
jgi:hypothetical protein